MGNVAHDVVSLKYSHGEAKAYSDDIEETSQLVGQVLRIKRVLDNSRHEKTKIGISVNSLRKNCGSKQIAQLACDITMCWKAMVEDICRRTEDVADPHKVGDGTTSSVKNQNIRKPGQVNEAGPLVNRNRRLNVKQHKGIVKPNMSSNTNSRTIPASDIASRKFERIKGWDEVVTDVKFQATKGKMQELYQKAETDKRRRTVQELDPRDLPKMATSREASRAKIVKGSQRRVISRSRVSCV